MAKIPAIILNLISVPEFRERGWFFIVSSMIQLNVNNKTN